MKLHLDTSVRAYKTDDAGVIQRDPDGNSIAIAFDVVSGTEYEKICEAVSDADPKVLGAKQEALVASGAKHYSSDVPGFTGWWKPVVSAVAADA